VRFEIKVPQGASQEMIEFAREIESAVVAIFKAPIEVPEYTIAGGLPDASQWANHFIAIPDETGGATLARSNGTSWLRVRDGAIAS
jgi:hypothetical protein